MSRVTALVSGIVGASALTALHETARRVVPAAPRADILGMRALAATLHLVDAPAPPRQRLFRWTLLGDLAGNSVYYSLVGAGAARHPWRRGITLGLLAGIGAVVLPGPLGLGRQTTSRTPATRVMTVLWYLLGGVAAAATAQRLARHG